MSANLTLEESVQEKGRQTDGQTDRQTEKVKRVELGLDFKVLGRYDCSSHLRSGWGERKTSGGRPIIICPTCRCDLVIFVRKPCFERSKREFGRGEEGRRGEGGSRGWKEKRGGRQGQKGRRSQEKKKKMGGWGGVSGTTVKWLRCYHGDSNEGSQDTLGGWRRRGLGRGGGGKRRVMVKRIVGGGGQKLKAGEGEKRPTGFFFLCSDKLTMLTHIILQCCHGNVLHEVLLTFTHHIILYKLFRKSTTLMRLQGCLYCICHSKLNKICWICESVILSKKYS